MLWEIKIGEKILQIAQGDITIEDTDAIVNAANSHLKHGGGVAGAILRRGGKVIQKESDKWVRERGPVPVGGVAVTSGGNLKAKYVIHAVGPIWRGGTEGESEKLREAIVNSLKTADELKLSSISLPAISTGIFGYPKEEAAEIIISAILSTLKDLKNLKLVKVVLYDEGTAKLFKGTAERLANQLSP